MAQSAKTQSTSTATEATTTGAETVADAFIYGYPLVIMDATRRISTAVPSPAPTRAPVNQFAHLPAFPDASFTDVVSPNADTLYSAAWLDLSTEPVVLSVPDMGNRYYLMPMLDAWTNVFSSPGTRTTGNSKKDFAIVGPGWSKPVPDGLTQIKAPTNIVWIIGRTQTNGKKDFDAVHAVQHQYLLTPLSSWGKQYHAPTDVPVDKNAETKTAPVDQVAQMDAATFFGRLNALMVSNPPSAADAPALARFAPFGIGPGKALDPKGLDPVLEAGLKLGRTRLTEEAKKPKGTSVNGWDILSGDIGRYGADYTLRAVVALVGLGANLPDDAVYPHATKDSSGKPLTGANTYTVHFAKGALPPVKAFWSLTMYNAKQFFVDNPINRFAHRRPRSTGLRSRWIAHAVHPARLAGKGQGSKLASSARGFVQSLFYVCTGHRS